MEIEHSDSEQEEKRMCFTLEEDSPSTSKEVEVFLNGCCLECPDRDQCSAREELENEMILGATIRNPDAPICLVCPYYLTCIKEVLIAD